MIEKHEGMKLAKVGKCRDQIPKFCIWQVVFAIEQLNKITSQETATSHEEWFQMTYSGAIKTALEALQNPPDPSDHRSSWEPFKQVITFCFCDNSLSVVTEKKNYLTFFIC